MGSMTLILSDIPKEIEQRLKTEAARSGMDEAAFATRLIEQGLRVAETPASQDKHPSDNPWVKALHEWADAHEPVSHFVDDSRERIYSGTLDDPR